MLSLGNATMEYESAIKVEKEKRHHEESKTLEEKLNEKPEPLNVKDGSSYEEASNAYIKEFGRALSEFMNFGKRNF
jgi:hypothetical protein